MTFVWAQTTTSSLLQLTYEYDAKSKERTFIMVKPDGVERGLVGEIIDVSSLYE